MSGRYLITSVLIACLLLTGCKQVGEVPQVPNILFFLTDDQRDETLGCYGHAIVKSPNIDRLAEEGVRFSNAFVTTSICMASRATIFSGMYSRANGVSCYQTPLDSTLTGIVYPVLMRNNGYRTGFTGKFGFKVSGSEQPETWFDYFKPVGRNPYFREMPDGSLRHETEINGDNAIEFLRSQDPDQPFCLSVSFNAAHAEDGDHRPGIGHFPWPRATDGMYENILPPEPRISDPAIFEAHPDFLKNSLNRERWFWRWDTPEKYQVNMRAYFRMISGIDRVIGRVLAELDELGMAENTIIIYSADNGYYMGDRGFAGKWTHYEESLRVPMIIYDPRAAPEMRGLVSDEMVLNVDLPSTFLDLAGIEIPGTYQGESLVPLTSRRVNNEWRKHFLCEFLYPYDVIPKWEGVRTEDHIYARYFKEDPDYVFLHDMKQDPDQLVNLEGDPEHAELKKELSDLCDNYIKAYER